MDTPTDVEALAKGMAVSLVPAKEYALGQNKGLHALTSTNKPPPKYLNY